MTTTKDATPTMQTFEIHVEHSAGSGTIKRVKAAYFQSDSDFITFKDPDHKVVLSVRANSVLSIERVAVQHDGEAGPISRR